MQKIQIKVCMGSSCFARGNAQNLEFIENYIKEHNIIADVDLSGERCTGNCAMGPNITINGIVYEQVDEDKIRKILDDFRR